MLPVTDLAVARVQLPVWPPGEEDSTSEEDGDEARGDRQESSEARGRPRSCEENEVCGDGPYGDVLLFRAGGRCWAALCPALPDSLRKDGDKSTFLTSPAELADTLEAAARDGLVTSVSQEAFERGPHVAALEALASHAMPAMRQLSPLREATSAAIAGVAKHDVDADGDEGTDAQAGGASASSSAALRPAEPEACGDGSIFRPFRFPTKMSDAFRLPWMEIGIVSDDQLRNFYEGTQMRSTPKRVIGAVGYLHQHYLKPFKQKILSKGRHLLVIKISENLSGRRPQKRCLAWWMPLSEVRERYADPKKAEMYHEGGSVHRVCQLVETYKLNATVPIHFEIGEKPGRLTVGGFPLHCFDLDAAVDFHTRWSLGSDPDALLEEKREVEHCIATHSVLQMSQEARKAEKRRRKRQNKKAREQNTKKALEEEVALAERDDDDEPFLELREKKISIEEAGGGPTRKTLLLQPNEALRDSSFLSSLLEQMRQR